MPQKVRFFKNTCSSCASDVALPFLGDMSYAEFIYQTKDGSEFALAKVVDEAAWDLIERIAQKEFAYDSSDRSTVHVFQSVAQRCADAIEGRRYTARKILCPRCGSPMRAYGPYEIAYDTEIPLVSWIGFKRMSRNEQRERVCALWLEELKTRW